MSFTTKYAVSRQMRPRILELTLALSSFFVSYEEKDCYRVISVGQLVSTAGRTGGDSHRRRQANNDFFLV